jgi:acyl-CoA synthetase (AMP-forming)/AMP-acid ligase II
VLSTCIQCPRLPALQYNIGREARHRLCCAGSTGVPKGVLCCHEGLINAMDFEISMRHKCGLGKDDPVMQTMAVFADMSGK